MRFLLGLEIKRIRRLGTDPSQLSSEHGRHGCTRCLCPMSRGREFTDIAPEAQDEENI